MKLKNKVESILVLIVVFIILSGCSSTPSVADAKKEIEWQIQQQSRGFISLVKFEKTNAQEATVLGGVKAYVLEYQAEIEFTNDCCYSAGHRIGGDFLARPLSEYCNETKVQKGQHLIIKGDTGFEKTEKGWRGDSGQIY